MEQGRVWLSRVMGMLENLNEVARGLKFPREIHKPSLFVVLRVHKVSRMNELEAQATVVVIAQHTVFPILSSDLLCILTKRRRNLMIPAFAIAQWIPV